MYLSYCDMVINDTDFIENEASIGGGIRYIGLVP